MSEEWTPPEGSDADALLELAVRFDMDMSEEGMREAMRLARVIEAQAAELERLRATVGRCRKTTMPDPHSSAEYDIEEEPVATEATPKGRHRVTGHVRPSKALMGMLATHLGGVPIETRCPDCGLQHIDRGEWATRLHKTHLCESCGALWRPYDAPTVGVDRTAALQADLRALVGELDQQIHDREHPGPYESEAFVNRGVVTARALRPYRDRLAAILKKHGGES